MSARHRQAKKRAAQLRELGNAAASSLAYGLVIAGALELAYRSGAAGRNPPDLPSSDPPTTTR